MLILVNSGSSHSFISSQFVTLAQLSTIPMPPRRVKLANADWLTTDKHIPSLQWYCQGHTLHSNMIVLDMAPYDEILGYDWLQTHNPMTFDWQLRTMEFLEGGKIIKLQGLPQNQLELHSISAHKVYNATKGNDVWAFALVDHIPKPSAPQQPMITDLLSQFADVFSDPQQLPP